MTHTEKDAIVRAALSYRCTYGGVLPNFAVEQIAAHAGVGRRTLRRWFTEFDAQTREQEEAMRAAKRRKKESASAEDAHRKGRPFQITEEHLTVIRSTLNLKNAYCRLWPTEDSPGRISYPTFTRAFKSLPPSIREGVLHGWDSMVRHQVYLSMSAPHRNHTWHLDWTQADVWVSLPRGEIVRPWVGIVRDNATSMRNAA